MDNAFIPDVSRFQMSDLHGKVLTISVSVDEDTDRMVKTTTVLGVDANGHVYVLVSTGERIVGDDPDHVGWGCRGLGLDHRWQKSEFSERYYCHKCGEQKPEAD